MKYLLIYIVVVYLCRVYLVFKRAVKRVVLVIPFLCLNLFVIVFMFPPTQLAAAVAAHCMSHYILALFRHPIIRRVQYTPNIVHLVAHLPPCNDIITMRVIHPSAVECHLT